jgi:hypothetical protein
MALNLDVLPVLARANAPDGLGVDPKLSCELVQACSGSTDAQHVTFGQSRLIGGDASRSVALGVPVGNVLCVSTNPQVRDLNATRDIACVADLHARRNINAYKQQRSVVGSDLALRAAIANGEEAIPITVTCQEPASAPINVRLINVQIEPLPIRLATCFAGASWATSVLTTTGRYAAIGTFRTHRKSTPSGVRPPVLTHAGATLWAIVSRRGRVDS